MKSINLKKPLEKDNVQIRLRKAYNFPDISGHTILTDDAFTYVDFYFQTHKKIRKLDGSNWSYINISICFS